MTDVPCPVERISGTPVIPATQTPDGECSGSVHVSRLGSDHVVPGNAVLLFAYFTALALLVTATVPRHPAPARPRRQGWDGSALIGGPI
jgi:hypothetical protein